MAKLPTQDEIVRAIQDEIVDRKVRPGEIVPFRAFNLNLQKQGYRSAEISDAFQAMAQKGWIEDDLSITDAGFEQL